MSLWSREIKLCIIYRQAKQTTRCVLKGCISKTVTFKGLAAPLGLLGSGFAQIGIEPAAESVLLVPAAFAVADQHELIRGHVAARTRFQMQRERSHRVTETEQRRRQIGGNPGPVRDVVEVACES